MEVLRVIKRFDTYHNDILDNILNAIGEKNFAKFVDIVESVNISYLDTSYYIEGVGGRPHKFIEMVLSKVIFVEEGSIALKCFWYLIRAGICTTYTNGKKQTLIEYACTHSTRSMVLNLLHSSKVTFTFTNSTISRAAKPGVLVINSILSYASFKLPIVDILHTMLFVQDDTIAYILYRYCMGMDKDICNIVKEYVASPKCTCRDINDQPHNNRANILRNANLAKACKCGSRSVDPNNAFIKWLCNQITFNKPNTFESLRTTEEIDFGIITRGLHDGSISTQDQSVYSLLAYVVNPNYISDYIDRLHALGWRLKTPDDILFIIVPSTVRDNRSAVFVFEAIIRFIYNVKMGNYGYACDIVDYIFDALEYIHNENIVDKVAIMQYMIEKSKWIPSKIKKLTPRQETILGLYKK